tara:strand:- start:844 stop:1329 length:486 start_codon:yes stop_codon:yes gene_type:complete
MAKKKKVEERISEALNIEHDLKPESNIVEGEIIDTEIVPVEPKKNIKDFHLERDYDDVRGNLKDIVEKGTVAIDGILAVASEGDSPRAYEVVSQLIKSVSEANKDLISLHKQIKDIKKDDSSSNQKAGSITNNSIFVGSTKALQDLVKNQRKQLEDLDNAE